MITEILNYKNVLEELPEMLNKSRFKMKYIIEKTGITSPTFYRKLKTLSFTVDEALTIAKILNPEEAYKQELLDSLNDGREDIINNKIKSSDEMRKAMREKIQAYQ